jgi:hypothetical protein
VARGCPRSGAGTTAQDRSRAGGPGPSGATPKSCRPPGVDASGGGTPRGVFGTPRAIAQGLAACGWTSHTACRERLHLDRRQRVAAVGRRGHTLGRGAERLRAPLVWCQTSHTLVRPQARWRQP